VKYLLLLFLLGCASADRNLMQVSCPHLQPPASPLTTSSISREFGKDGQILVKISNVYRVAVAHCEALKDCHVQIDLMCGEGNWTILQEKYLISKLHDKGNDIYQYDMYGLYFMIAGCKSITHD